MTIDERRSYVRGDLSFKVQFKILTSDEYEYINTSDGEIFSPFKKEQRLDAASADISNYSTENATIITYLFHMDEKLDQILEILSREKTREDSDYKGVGLNISGSGMKLKVDTPVESGQIVHLKFLLSKLPLVFMDVFGEVVRVTHADEDGLYFLGIKFLDLSVNDRERIVSLIFQKQRETIRKTKMEIE